MDESTKDELRRNSKHSKMRESLQSAFGDPLEDFKIPIAVRHISSAMESQSAELEDRIRKISASSDEQIGDEPSRTIRYIDQRETLVEDLDVHLKEGRRMVRETMDQASRPERKELKRTLTELDQSDSIVLKERAALAANRVRVEYSMQGQASSVKIGEAYRIAITDTLPEPADASYNKQQKRSPSDQSSFRNRLIKTYCSEGSRYLETPEFSSTKIWCPISGREFYGDSMKAAHIVPHSIGEANAAYLFGLKPYEGFQVIWSERNGLMLHQSIEKIFDDGRLVIVPDPTDDNEFLSIVLSQDLLRQGSNNICPATDAPWSSIHNKRLQFQTGSRPGKRFMYIHALLTLLRRRRYIVPGWEKDRDQVFTGQIWATPGKWARRSMVQALAVEIGDSWDNIDVGGEALGDFPDGKAPEEEKKLATEVGYSILKTQDADMELEVDE
ncbi:hypothetical protein LTR47_005707 [Exophiala xenobiotica]|nr:hypothetical protein LTR92_009701 [Exophiala xenobiotica]KAK5205004.1 hypothetical protein LTR41_009214 [Exophiala xenobiotica]KAK5233210.1 hypothetical protein LTR47_005707 [Exophiala xenobiotica]KAK5250791.1 hypothetical protein LTS06_004499 [Exophiala xenobiotica]KAK5292948.1 hypothetical protein LTR14_005297 [Exophiala xenobiotica]